MNWKTLEFMDWKRLSPP